MREKPESTMDTLRRTNRFETAVFDALSVIPSEALPRAAESLRRIADAVDASNRDEEEAQGEFGFARTHRTTLKEQK